MEYRRVFLSYMKNALAEYSDGKYFKEFFDGTYVRRYCFSVFLPRWTLEKEFFKLNDKKIEVTISTSDLKTGAMLYNAICSQKQKKFPLAFGNEITLKTIRLENDRMISGNKILGKTTMPLCVRLHDKETNKDTYFSFGDEQFHQMLKMVLVNHVKSVLNLDELIFDGFSFTPTQMKKTIVRHYGQMIPVSLGVFEMRGNPILLNLFYSEGFGSRRSAGFGMFTILDERNT